MKDMFLAEELGYDPYEPYPPDENILTEKDFKESTIIMSRKNSRPSFKEIRAEKKAIPLSQLTKNLKENIFYSNLCGGYFDSKENIILICKQFNMKVVCWDYVRMLAVLESKQ